MTIVQKPYLSIYDKKKKKKNTTRNISNNSFFAQITQHRHHLVMIFCFKFQP